MKRRIQSSNSGEYTETKYGQLKHTNNHWWIRGERKIEGWVHHVPSEIMKVIRAGDASTCSIIEIDVPAFERWLDKHFLNSGSTY